MVIATRVRSPNGTSTNLGPKKWGDSSKRHVRSTLACSQGWRRGLSSHRGITARSSPDVPLVAVDALHLGAMLASVVVSLATADMVMARAAQSVGMECRVFF